MQQKEKKNGKSGENKPVNHPPKEVGISDLPKDVSRALNKMDITELTEIQRKSIPYILEKNEMLGIASTGSGKTLAFLIPAVSLLKKRKDVLVPRVLIVTPTRELALQISRVADRLLDLCFVKTRTALLVGGTRKSQEQDVLRSGAGIVVCTPGRLVDHLGTGLSLQRVKMAVLDESDRMLEGGFETDLDRIRASLSSKVQVLMFSATKTHSMLYETWFRKKYAVVEAEPEAELAANLLQSFVVCPEDKRFSMLFAFLRSTKEKVIVFFSSCASVIYHGDIFSLLKFNVEVLHGGVKQDRRSRVFDAFCSGALSILFSTDVAARGLDVPDVKWIVQYDPPSDPKEYIHRVGRTARAGRSGKALLFLLPHEKPFISYLKSMNVQLEEWECKDLKDVSKYYIKAVSSNYYLGNSAREALRGYIQSYSAHRLRRLFDASKIQLNKIARSFGFEEMPKVDINL